MNNLYRVSAKKSHLGKSPSQIVAKASVTKFAAGNFEIVTPDYPGCILQLTEDGNICIAEMQGTVAVVEASPRALEKMKALRDAVKEAYNKEYR